MTTSQTPITQHEVTWTLKHTRTGDKLTADPIPVLVAMGCTDAEIGALCRGRIVKGLVLNTKLISPNRPDNAAVRRAAKQMQRSDRAGNKGRPRN